MPPASEVLAHATGDIDGRPGDVAAPVAGYERDQPRYLVWPPESAQRHLGGGELPEKLFGRGVGRAPAVDVLPLRRRDEPDVDAVHQDSFAAEVHGKSLGQAKAGSPVDR